MPWKTETTPENDALVVAVDVDRELVTVEIDDNGPEFDPLLEWGDWGE